MSALSVNPPFPIFTETDGQPLDNGYIWIGTANLNPIVNPIAVYWDAALTVAAVQPIRTLGGYPANSGTPARLYVNSDYSIQVQNRNGSVVSSAPAATERYGGIINASDVVYDPAGTRAVATTVQTKLRESVSVTDFGIPVTNASFNTALAAAVAMGNRTVVLPEGTTLLTDTVIVPASITIKGHGKDSTIVKAGTWVGIAGAPLFSKPVGSAYAANHVFQDMTIDGNSTQAGMLIYQSYHNHFLRVDFVDCLGYSVKLTEAGDTKFDFCQFSGMSAATDYGVYVDGGSGTQLDHCNFQIGAGIGIGSSQANYLGYTSGCWATNSLFQSFGAGIGIDVLNGQQQWVVDTCYFEGFGGATMTPIAIGARGVGDGTNVTFKNNLVASGNNIDPVVAKAGTLIWENNISGRGVNFLAPIGMLYHIGNAYEAGTSPTFSCAKYVDMTGKAGGAATGAVAFVGVDVSVGTSTIFGTLTVDTSKGTSGANQVVFGDMATPANATKLYLRGTTADCGLITGGANLSLGSAAAEWLSVQSTRVNPGGTSGSMFLGDSSHLWNTVYAATGTINTSDAREKTPVRALTTAEINASKQIGKEIGAYQFLSSVAEKGLAAREHIGMTVQHVIEIMQANGLDPFGYGFICYDKWDEEIVHYEAVEDIETGTFKPAYDEVRPSGDRYAFRMDELLMFIARGFEERLFALENK